MKLSEVKTRPSICVLGEPGSGKTSLIGSFCELLPTVVVTSDLQGIDTLKTMRVDAEIIYIDDWTRCWFAYQDIQKALAKGYRVIALDDFGASQDQIKNKAQMMPRGDEARLSIEKRSLQIRESLMKGDRRLLGPQWGEVAVAAEAFLTEVAALPAQIFIATIIEDLRESPRTGLEHIYPSLQGRIRFSILARFSLVVEAFKAQDQAKVSRYCLTCREHVKLPTKTRYGQGRTWVDPTASKLLAHINRKEEGDYAETKLEQFIGTGIPA